MYRYILIQMNTVIDSFEADCATAAKQHCVEFHGKDWFERYELYCPVTLRVLEEWEEQT
jgi:hypothetical protein